MSEPIKVSDWSQPVKISLMVVFLILFIFISWKLLSHKGSLLGNIQLGVVATNTSSSVTVTTPTLIQAEADGAAYRSFTNMGANTVWLSFKSTSTGFVALTGYALKASDTLQMTENFGNLWQGNVYALTVVGSSSVSMSQF